MDSDKVIVMDLGQAVEFDHPHILLENSSGYFSHMVGETGNELEKKLRKIAEDDYNKKYFTTTSSKQTEMISEKKDEEKSNDTVTNEETSEEK